MSEPLFRPAQKTECRTIAELYSISSDGVADYVWTTLAEPGESILDVGQRRYEQEDSPFSYRNCIVAEIDGEIAGMLVAFPMYVDTDYQETDPVMRPYAVLEEDQSYYVCGIALLEAYRNAGAGSRMMKLAEDQAGAHGLEKMSLIVFESNEAALRLYERLGYVEKMREAIVPHPLIRCTGDAILMVKRL